MMWKSKKSIRLKSQIVMLAVLEKLDDDDDDGGGDVDISGACDNIRICKLQPQRIYLF
jgi:hypothetical protein